MVKGDDNMGIKLEEVVREGYSVRANGRILSIAASLDFYAKDAAEVRIYRQSELEPPGPADEYVLLTRRKIPQ